MGNGRRVKKYLNMRQANLIEILLLHKERQKGATLQAIDDSVEELTRYKKKDGQRF